MGAPYSRVKNERRAQSPDDEWAAELVDKMTSSCHDWQLDVVEDQSRRISVLVGRGGGKTTALRVRGLKAVLTQRRVRVLYFAKTRVHAKDLMWFGLKDVTDHLGLVAGRDCSYNETELRLTVFRTGSVYQLSGAADLGEIEKWRGMSFIEVQVDEGASHSNELLDVLLYRIIGPRLGKTGTVVMSGTPGHVMSGTFYDVTRPGSDQHKPYRDDGPPRTWSSHRWTLEDVVGLPESAERFPALCDLWEGAKAEFERNSWTPDNPIRKREYGGQWAADNTTSIYQYQARTEAGDPWNEWDPVKVGEMGIAELPPGDDWIYVVGMDQGARDPFALGVFCISPSDKSRTIYHVYEFEQQEMYARRIAILLLGRDVEVDLERAHSSPGGLIGAIGWPAAMVSDIAQLGLNILDELSNVYGIRIKPAEQKGKLSSIEMVNSDLVSGRLRIMKGSKLAQQFSDLQWVKDEYGFPRENKAQANHSADCCLYARRELAHHFDAATDAQPPAKSRRVEPDRLVAPVAGEFDFLFEE